MLRLRSAWTTYISKNLAGENKQNNSAISNIGYDNFKVKRIIDALKL
jgi:hypothetical protein